MTFSNLGRLEPVDLRAIWTNESGDFTPWLAQEENLALLADTIGLEMELVGMERAVGPFRADIVCKDTITGNLVLIENQIETTDHSHLGQLLTYAAGLHAVTVVWIARRFTEEHRAALDWLNEVTNENIDLFGLEIEAWRIGSSAIAPKFNIVSQPNDWVKRVAQERAGTGRELTPTQQLQLEYWGAFNELVIKESKTFRPQKPQPQHWMTFPVGRSNFWLSADVNTRKNQIGVSIWMSGPNAKQHFQFFEDQKSSIEEELTEILEWYKLPNKKSSYIWVSRLNSNIADRNEWPAQHAWLLERLEAFHPCFSHRVKAIGARTIKPSEIEDTP
jgi:hypothetical protein